MRIPDSVAGQRTRKNPDGSFWLPRNNRQVKEILSEHFINYPGTNRWIPRINNQNDVIQLRHYFENKSCYIIGKGPSLDNLSSINFSTIDPIIALNEAIHKVASLKLRNPLFGLQQDKRLKDTCYNSDATMMISRQARLHYDEEKVFSYVPESYNCTSASLSVIVAIEMMKAFKATGVILLCFDGCVNNVYEYAKCIGYKVEGDATRFKDHRKVIDTHLENMSTQWVIPKAHVKQDDDKLQQLQYNQQENHDHDQV